jgi:hypothetical protein
VSGLPGGEQHPAVHIQLNPAQLAADGLDLEDVRTALANVSVVQPKGSLYGQDRSYSLQTADQILKPQDWDNQIIAYRNGGPIWVRDVGNSIIGPQDETLKGSSKNRFIRVLWAGMTALQTISSWAEDPGGDRISRPTTVTAAPFPGRRRSRPWQKCRAKVGRRTKSMLLPG